MADKQALVSQSLDEFKAYLLSVMEQGVAKRDVAAVDVAMAKRHLAGAVRKVGAKVSAARREKLQAAADALNEVLAEVAEETTTEKRADAQEADMTADELAAAIAKANEPLLARLDKLEGGKAAETPTPEAPVAKAEAAEDEPTLGDVIKAVGALADRVEKIETARGARTSADGQEGETVAKRGLFAGTLQ